MALSQQDRDVHEIVHILNSIDRGIKAHNNLMAKLVVQLKSLEDIKVAISAAGGNDILEEKVSEATDVNPEN